MVTIIIIMGVLITVLFILVMLLSGVVGGINKQLIEVDKEQHNQNKEIIELMKGKMQHQDMLLVHIEIIKYLVEQDPILGKTKIPYTGVVGEA